MNTKSIFINANTSPVVTVSQFGTPLNPTTEEDHPMATANSPTDIAIEHNNQLATITEDYIMSLGTNSAKGLTELTTKILSTVSATTGAEMTSKLDQLIDTTKSMSIENYKASPLKKMMNKVLRVKDHALEKFQTANDRVNTLVKQLEKEKNGQENDRKMIDQLAEQNYTYCKAIIDEINDAESKREILQQAIDSFGKDLDYDQQKALDDLQSKYDMIDRKLVDLEATKVLSMNMEPKLKLMKQGAISLVGTFDNIVLRVVPMYMQQFSAYIIASRQDQALKLGDRTITMFNEGITMGSDLAAKNAEANAKLSQRQLIDVETIRKDHANVVDSLDKVKRITEEARVNRKAVLQEIKAMEQDTLNAFSKKS